MTNTVIRNNNGFPAKNKNKKVYIYILINQQYMYIFERQYNGFVNYGVFGFKCINGYVVKLVVMEWTRAF